MTIAPGADSSSGNAGAVPNGARCKSAAGAIPWSLRERLIVAEFRLAFQCATKDIEYLFQDDEPRVG